MLRSLAVRASVAPAAMSAKGALGSSARRGVCGSGSCPPRRLNVLPGGRTAARRVTSRSRSSSSRPLFWTATQTFTRQKSSAAALAHDVPDPESDGGGGDMPAHVNNSSSSSATYTSAEVHRLSHLRNVGILAHVDAGKTTVTERMLALAGVVRRAGSVDSGNTLTDYLPAERERGITIQSAAISFDWDWHNNRTGTDYDANDNVTVHLIDTPGHVDFSVEVNRSVAVLDGAVLVVDAVAGVQAQTETVWRAITRPSMNNHQRVNAAGNGGGGGGGPDDDRHGHEPLPCLALVNKMDKEGCNFAHAVKTLRYKLPGANPIATQIPLFRVGNDAAAVRKDDDDDGGWDDDDVGLMPSLPPNIHAVPTNDVSSPIAQSGEFVGVVDLVHMRAVVWPDLATASASNVEDCVPTVTNLMDARGPLDPNCHVARVAMACRAELVGSLADVDESMEEYYLLEEEPSNAEVRAALRRATLSRRALPVMAGAALRGKGVEPLLDAIADLLPSPLDRMPPALMRQDDAAASAWGGKRKGQKAGNKDGRREQRETEDGEEDNESTPLRKVTLGHPLHPKTLALAFKVVHMKGRGGSGDGRVVFARVYSGRIRARDALRVITPPVPGAMPEPPRTERVGSLLELAGGRFDNLEDGSCMSGDVCALVGLKSVATGDTILLASDDDLNGGGKKARGKKKGNKNGEGNVGNVYLAGVASPKPVLTVRVEAESTEQQSKLSDALSLLAIEDPSLFVEESDSATLLSGLGELHIEIVLDRLRREFGLEVTTGSPAVSYRETVTSTIATPGLVEYDRTIGGTRMQASVHLSIEPIECPVAANLAETSSCMLLSDPMVTIGSAAREFLGVEDKYPEEELIHRSDVVKALVSGCLGSLKRGAIGPYSMANVRCHVIDIDAEGGLSSLVAMPGSARAAAAHSISSLLHGEQQSCTVLEPAMSVEVTVPGEMVGTVLSDLTGRRGTVGDVVMGEDVNGQQAPAHAKALVRGEVPLVEILGYANSLRSLTGGEGAFTAEYKGHSPCGEEGE